MKDRYRIDRRIGKGGMAEVYLAEDRLLDRPVALKFLPDSMQHDPIARERLRREAKAAASLDHPFICKIYEIGEVDRKIFVAMELVTGETLQQRLSAGPLPLGEALEKATELAKALEEAHKHRIVHRDFKPSNIMLTEQGYIKVMDFGLAKEIPKTVTESEAETLDGRLTEVGARIGTPAYMSPEQILGGDVGVPSDIFSFGIETCSGSLEASEPRAQSAAPRGSSASSLVKSDSRRVTESRS